MLKFLGENYYIDINELESQVTIVDNTKIVLSGETKNEDQISLPRFEIFKSLIEVILTEREDIDEGLGIHGAKDLTIPFKIAFNTLLIKFQSNESKIY